MILKFALETRYLEKKKNPTNKIGAHLSDRYRCTQYALSKIK